MKFKHIRVIDTTEGVYLNAVDVLSLLYMAVKVFPSNSLMTLFRTMFKYHADYLRARRHNAKGTRA